MRKFWDNWWGFCIAFILIASLIGFLIWVGVIDLGYTVQPDTSLKESREEVDKSLQGITNTYYDMIVKLYNDDTVYIDFTDTQSEDTLTVRRLYVVIKTDTLP